MNVETRGDTSTSTNEREARACEGMDAWVHSDRSIRIFGQRLRFVVVDVTGTDCPARATYRVRLQCSEGHSQVHDQCDEHTEWAIRHRIMCSVRKCKSVEPMSVTLREPIP